MNLHHVAAVLVTCTILPFTTFAAETPTGAANSSPAPVVVLDNVPLVDAIRNLARQANLNYILDPKVAALNTTVSGRWTNSNPQTVLNDLLQKHTLTNVASASTSVSRIAPANGSASAVLTNQARANADEVIPLLVIDDVPLPDVIQNLVTAAKLNVIIDPKAKATPAFTRPERVSFRWEKITIQQALMALLDNYDLVLVEVPASAPAHITPRINSGTKP